MRHRFFPLLLAALLLLSGCTFLPPRSDAAALDFSEMAEIFALTDDAVLSRFGEPDEEKTAVYTGLTASEFRYGRNIFRTEAHSGYIYYVCLYEDALPAPRDLRIGMKAREVVSRFASSGAEDLRTGQDGASYRLLYGDYDEGLNYGAVLYEGRTPRLIEYASEGCILACGLRGGRVEYIEYVFGYLEHFTGKE